MVALLGAGSGVVLRLAHVEWNRRSAIVDAMTAAIDKATGGDHA